MLVVDGAFLEFFQKLLQLLGVHLLLESQGAFHPLDCLLDFGPEPEERQTDVLQLRLLLGFYLDVALHLLAVRQVFLHVKRFLFQIQIPQQSGRGVDIEQLANQARYVVVNLLIVIVTRVLQVPEGFQ